LPPLAKAQRKLLGSVTNKKVLVFSGKGNNGGDGFVVARHMINQGADVKVFLLSHPKDIKGDAGINLRVLQAMGAKIYPIVDDKDLHRVDISLFYAHVVIDAIYGTGFKGAIKGITSKLVKMINDSKRPVISVDLPSGLEADTGGISGDCINANATVTFGLPKMGLFLEPGHRFAGEIEVADISIPQGLLNSGRLKRRLITSEWVQQILPRRDCDAHKGDFGHILLLGGSPGMSGAIYLAAMGALKSGAGLVTAAVPLSLHAILEQKLTEAMTRPLPENADGLMGYDAIEPIIRMCDKVDVVAIGPGMGVSKEGENLLKELLLRIKQPVVLDADGLNSLSAILENDQDFLKKVPSGLVLTPHPGEMSRLTQLSVAEVQQDRLGVAERFAKQWGVTIVLKGSRTIVATPDSQSFINITGNPGMATGGMGDVLTGMIAGFAGQGVSLQHASAMAPFIHGCAADAAAKNIGSSVTDRITLANPLKVYYSCFYRQNRLQVNPFTHRGTGVYSIKGKSRPNHIQMRIRMPYDGCTVSTMPNRKCQAFVFQQRKLFDKCIKLGVSKIRFIVVCFGKMSIYTGDLYPGQPKKL
jgi:hydroxyethylthiazole kinase-like uncharacterized protein yjeF